MSTEDVLDYSRSFAINTSAQDGVERNTCRTQLLARCTLPDATGAAREFFLGKECIGEYMYQECGIAQEPTSEVCIIFSTEDSSLLKKFANHESDVEQAGEMAVPRKGFDGSYANAPRRTGLAPVAAAHQRLAQLRGDDRAAAAARCGPRTIEARLDGHGDTALHRALEGWLDSDPYAKRDPNGIPNHRSGREIVALLREYGAYYDALHQAATVDVTELLIERGADVDARDSKGRTPLFLACQGGAVEKAEFLIVLGARTTIRNDKALSDDVLATERRPSSRP